MILDPINSITSIEFYKRVAKQNIGRSVSYLFYLALLFSIAATIALKVNGGPVIDETFRWLETSMPVITAFNGRLSTPAGKPVTVRHPSIAEISITVDTARLEPLTFDMLEKDKLLAYVTGNALYVRKSPGKMETYDLSKAAAKPGDKPVVIDAAFYRKAGVVVSRILYPSSLVLAFLVFLPWKTFSTGLYSLMALLVNSMTGAKLEYKALFSIALYAQTLVIILQAIFLFLPVPLPAANIVSTLLTGVYIWLAVQRNMESVVDAA
jgi:hypothetical protein